LAIVGAADNFRLNVGILPLFWKLIPLTAILGRAETAGRPPLSLSAAERTNAEPIQQQVHPGAGRGGQPPQCAEAEFPSCADARR